MTKEEKQLLSEDVCARLPYGLIAQYKQKTFYPYGEYTVDVKIEVDDMLCHRLKLLDFKPYLRSLFSMTQEEKCQFRKFVYWTYDCNWNSNTIEGLLNGNKIISQYAIELFGWLNAHHFDYRGLITMGLAIEAPKGMYEIPHNTI